MDLYSNGQMITRLLLLGAMRCMKAELPYLRLTPCRSNYDGSFRWHILLETKKTAKLMRNIHCFLFFSFYLRTLTLSQVATVSIAHISNLNTK